ncbi:hypothetical protein D9M73_265790 [compost metagenome]
MANTRFAQPLPGVALEQVYPSGIRCQRRCGWNAQSAEPAREGLLASLVEGVQQLLAAALT